MKILDKILLASSSFLFASPVFADEDPAQLSGIGDVLDRVVKLIFPVAGLVCVVFIIIGGYMWIISAGDPGKVKQAQGTLTWAIIGLIFILVAGALINVIMNFVTA